MTYIVYLNGKLIPEEKATVSVFDRGFTHGDGLFETIRVRNQKPFRLSCHYARMLASAKAILLNMPIELEQLGSVIQKLVDANHLADAMVRVQLTRGSFVEGLDIISNLKPTLVITAKPFTPVPDEWGTQGIRVGLLPASSPNIATLDRQIKSSCYLSNLLARQWAKDNECQEALLMVNQDQVSEGATSNVFLVYDGRLITPAINEYVLSGVTRKVTLECASVLNIEYEEDAVSRPQLLEADELFITNSRLGIVPVREISGEKKTFKTPGSITKLLRDEYLKIIDAECPSC